MSNIINSRQSQIVTTLNSKNWAGFADAKPSESIQEHDLPGLSVVALFPYQSGVGIFDIPVKQFKDVKKINQKINNAEKLTEWLHEQKNEGLIIHGFCLTQTQITAAEYGLRLIEELPNIRIEHHYNTYRLYFEDSYIDFAQAVALMYYLFAVYFGMLRPGIIASKLDASLILYMDRFPGACAGNPKKGQPIPKTGGMKFVEYARKHSSTYRSIEEHHKSDKVEIEFKTLDWWSPLDEKQIYRGKTHPHFLLPDWLVAASLANEYRGEFISGYSPYKKSVQLADKLESLYKAFKLFDIQSMDDKSFSLIRPNSKEFEISQDAEEFIMKRAKR